MLNIHSIETFGTHEGPGIRLVVFCQGCNLKCLYCQNPDTQETKTKREIEASELLELLEKEKEYFADGGGITFSGGEPTFQAKELAEICEKIQKAGYHVAIDTNGTIFNDDVKKLYDVVDLSLLDVKHINSQWHEKITGYGNENVLKTAEYLEKISKKMWIRYVFVPGFTDQDEYLKKFGEHFKNYEMIERVEILPYHTLGKYKYDELGWDYKLKNVIPPTPEQINKALKILKNYLGSKVFIR